jgi:hypothetical protein
MANVPTPKLHTTLPVATKVPLGSFIEQFNVPGMTPEASRNAALLIQSGKAGYPVGTGNK